MNSVRLPKLFWVDREALIRPAICTHIALVNEIEDGVQACLVGTEEVINDQQEDQMIQKHHKGSDEIYIPDAESMSKLSDTTLYRWIRQGFLPAIDRIGGTVIKLSALQKVEIAYGKYGKKKWSKHVKYTSEEKFEAPTTPLLHAHLELTAQQKEQVVFTKANAIGKTESPSVAYVLSQRQSELVSIAARLDCLGERDLSAFLSQKIILEMKK